MSTRAANPTYDRRGEGSSSSGAAHQGRASGRGSWRGRDSRGQATPGAGSSSRGEGTETNTDSRGGYSRGGRGRGGRRGRGNGREASAPRPTHFLAFPLKHPPLRRIIADFQSKLLQAQPPIAGLDQSIVVDPRRVHLTLGVMALEKEGAPSAAPAGSSSTEAGGDAERPRRTISSALSLLSSLKPEIDEALSSQASTSTRTLAKPRKLTVILDHLDVFPPGSTTKSNVLFLGPSDRSNEHAEWDRLWKVADLIHQTFKREGYITDTRGLTLHCTLLNTSYRKPLPPTSTTQGAEPHRMAQKKWKLKKEGFSFDDVVRVREALGVLGGQSDAGDEGPVAVQSEIDVAVSLRSSSIGGRGASASATTSTTASVAIQQASSSHSEDAGNGAPGRTNRRSKPIPVDLGMSFDVDTVELWVMGSHGPDNEYVSVGGIRLLDE